MAGQHTVQSNQSTNNLPNNNNNCNVNSNVNNVTNCAIANNNAPICHTNHHYGSGIKIAKYQQLQQQTGNQRHVTTPAAVKKQGVSGESSDTTGQLSSRDILIPKYDKDFRSKQLIKDAIMENDFLKNIDSSQVRELVDSMYSREVSQGEYVIREGEAGAHLFVAAEGDFEVIKDGQVLGRMGAGRAFGELAILYNCTRTASIKGGNQRFFPLNFLL